MCRQIVDIANVECTIAIEVARLTQTACVDAYVIDRQDFDALAFLIAVGTVADADVTFTVLVEHGDAANLSDAAAVADEDLVGTEAGAAFQFDDDDEVRKIRSGAAEIKSAKPAVVKPTAAKSAASKPKIVKSLERNRAVLEKVTPKQTPPKAAPKKSAAKPAAKSPAPKPVAMTSKQTTPARSSLIAAPRPVPKKSNPGVLNGKVNW